MKKAKVFLSTIGVAAILGGILAIKAHGRLVDYYCTPTTATKD